MMVLDELITESGRIKEAMEEMCKEEEEVAFITWVMAAIVMTIVEPKEVDHGARMIVVMIVEEMRITEVEMIDMGERTVMVGTERQSKLSGV